MPPSPNYDGFAPLQATNSPEDSPNPAGMRSPHGDVAVDIPLTPIRSNLSTGARKEGQVMERERAQTASTDNGGAFHHHIGRRRMTGGMDASLYTGGAPDGALTTMGRFYEKLLNFSVVTRYLLYILPLALCFLIVILVSLFAAPYATIGGVKMVWFFVWLEIVWGSLWGSKLFAKMLPIIFQALVGVVSSGVKKYSLVIQALEMPISLVGWAIASLCSFLPLMVKNHDLSKAKQGQIQDWERRMNLFLISCLIASLVILAERLLIQIVSVDYHRRQFSERIQTNKANVRFLSILWETSRTLFPEYTEFVEEDTIIRQGLVGGLAGGLNIPGFIPGMKQSGSATPMRQLFGNINMVQDKVASAFGNIAQEVTGNKNVFNPNGAYAVVIDALQRKTSAEALAKRIWLSFVPEGASALTRADLLEVMGPEHELRASECFESLDADNNGDVSLDEMILHVLNIRTERYDVAKSMQDVDNAISALDNVLMFIVFIVIVLVFVVAQQSSIGTVIAGAGTVMISLSFVFAATAQEVLGSCIFLFVKHPYDVGDRVDLDGDMFLVEHISLLYTVLRRVDNGKSTQMPNSTLNTKSIENITRSKNMTESLTVAVNYATTFQDIQKLKEELLLFVHENNRDFLPDLDVAVKGVGKLDALELRIDMNFKGNWSNSALTAERRNKFICALVLILKRIPIYGAGAGDPALGEQGKPSFSVSIPPDVAQKYIQNAAETKASKRWDYAKDTGNTSSAPTMTQGATFANANTAAAAVTAEMNSAADYGVPSCDGLGDDASTVGRGSSETKRGQDLEEVRALLSRPSTKGRRKASPGGSQRPHSPSQYPNSSQYSAPTQYGQGSSSGASIQRGQNY